MYVVVGLEEGGMVENSVGHEPAISIYFQVSSTADLAEAVGEALYGLGSVFTARPNMSDLTIVAWLDGGTA